MGRLPRDRPQEALQIWRRWDRSRSKDSVRATRQADKALDELALFCAPEIAEALNTFKKSGSLLLFDLAGTLRKLIHRAVLESAQTLKDKPARQLLEHVKYCVMEVLTKAETEQQKNFQELTSEQIIEIVMTWPRQHSTLVLDRLSFAQGNDLVVELLRRRPAYRGISLSLDLDDEPEDSLLWLLWYVFRLHMKEPSVSSLLAEADETPTGLIVDLSGELGAQPRNNRGEPINLAGPILVKVFDVLTGLPNNQIPAPARSNTRLGGTFSVDPDVIARWRRHPEWQELRVDIEPDGEGGVYHTFDLDALLRSARIVIGCKRGPKSKPSPKNSS